MTYQEALKQNFECTKLRASIPVSTCLARQEGAENTKQGHFVAFYHCLDCEQGKQNIKEWEERNGMGVNAECECCGRNRQMKKRVEGHMVCGRCLDRLQIGASNGWTYDEIQPEIKRGSGGVTRGHYIQDGDAFYRKSKPVKVTEEKCEDNVKIVHVDFPKDGKLVDQASTFEPENLPASDNGAPLHEMGFPLPAPGVIETLKAPDCTLEIPLECGKVGFTKLQVPDFLVEEPALLAWIGTIASRERRTVQGQILHILDILKEEEDAA